MIYEVHLLHEVSVCCSRTQWAVKGHESPQTTMFISCTFIWFRWLIKI